jgi:hypothetical protein
MKHANRPFLSALLLMLVLLCGVGASRPIRNGCNSTTDCTDQCKERYDAMIKRCNESPTRKGANCEEAAQKQYDSCLEKCKNNSSGERPGL